MRVIFAGTPEFAAQALQAVASAGHEIPLVLTQPDRPAGRGMKLQASPVKQLAQALALPVAQPESLRTPEAQALLREVAAEVMVVAAYGLILPQAVLDLPRWGCLNIHASLLPRWRGAAPIQRAIAAGDRQTGVCIMQMEAGLDTGPVILREAIPISDEDTAGSLHDRLSALGARLIVAALANLPLSAEPQPEAGVCYAHKIDKMEARIDWRQPAEVVDRHIRAFNPFPGALATLSGEAIKCWRSRLAPGSFSGAPGSLLACDRQGVVVACGSGAVCLTELQRSGARRLPVADFLAGNAWQPGLCLDLP